MKKYRYFTQADFDKCVPPCKIEDMNENFMDKVDNARHLAGIPFVPKSAYRSVVWEKSKGRTGNGDHPNRCGIDISATTGTAKFKIVQSAIACGITRIGINKNYIHLGDTPSLPQSVIWLY